MVVGNKSQIAVESSITRAYHRPSLRALGYFVIHITGQRYGIVSPDATMLGCSFDEVKERLTRRGTHNAPFAMEPNAKMIAEAVSIAIYSEEQRDEGFFGMTRSEFCDIVHTNRIIWAPDGDEAFDDGSHVLHFDVGNRVRLIGFKRDGNDIDQEYRCLTDLWVAAEEYYQILQHWHDLFESEWRAAPKWEDDENLR